MSVPYHPTNIFNTSQIYKRDRRYAVNVRDQQNSDMFHNEYLRLTKMIKEINEPVRKIAIYNIIQCNITQGLYQNELYTTFQLELKKFIKEQVQELDLLFLGYLILLPISKYSEMLLQNVKYIYGDDEFKQVLSQTYESIAGVIKFLQMSSNNVYENIPYLLAKGIRVVNDQQTSVLKQREYTEQYKLLQMRLQQVMNGADWHLLDFKNTKMVIDKDGGILLDGVYASIATIQANYFYEYFKTMISIIAYRTSNNSLLSSDTNIFSNRMQKNQLHKWCLDTLQGLCSSSDYNKHIRQFVERQLSEPVEGSVMFVIEGQPKHFEWQDIVQNFDICCDSYSNAHQEDLNIVQTLCDVYLIRLLAGFPVEPIEKITKNQETLMRYSELTRMFDSEKPLINVPLNVDAQLSAVDELIKKARATDDLQRIVYCIVAFIKMGIFPTNLVTHAYFKTQYSQLCSILENTKYLNELRYFEVNYEDAISQVYEWAFVYHQNNEFEQIPQNQQLQRQCAAVLANIDLYRYREDSSGGGPQQYIRTKFPEESLALNSDTFLLDLEVRDVSFKQFIESRYIITDFEEIRATPVFNILSNQTEHIERMYSYIDAMGIDRVGSICLVQNFDYDKMFYLSPRHDNMKNAMLLILPQQVFKLQIERIDPSNESQYIQKNRQTIEYLNQIRQRRVYSNKQYNFIYVAEKAIMLNIPPVIKRSGYHSDEVDFEFVHGVTIVDGDKQVNMQPMSIAMLHMHIVDAELLRYSNNNNRGVRLSMLPDIIVKAPYMNSQINMQEITWNLHQQIDEDLFDYSLHHQELGPPLELEQITSVRVPYETKQIKHDVQQFIEEFDVLSNDQIALSVVPNVQRMPLGEMQQIVISEHDALQINNPLVFERLLSEITNKSTHMGVYIDSEAAFLTVLQLLLQIISQRSSKAIYDQMFKQILESRKMPYAGNNEIDQMLGSDLFYERETKYWMSRFIFVCSGTRSVYLNHLKVFVDLMQMLQAERLSDFEALSKVFYAQYEYLQLGELLTENQIQVQKMAEVITDSNPSDAEAMCDKIGELTQEESPHQLLMGSQFKQNLLKIIEWMAQKGKTKKNFVPEEVRQQLTKQLQSKYYDRQYDHLMEFLMEILYHIEVGSLTTARYDILEHRITQMQSSGDFLHHLLSKRLHILLRLAFK